MLDRAGTGRPAGGSLLEPVQHRLRATAIRMEIRRRISAQQLVPGGPGRLRRVVNTYPPGLRPTRERRSARRLSPGQDVQGPLGAAPLNSYAMARNGVTPIPPPTM